MVLFTEIEEKTMSKALLFTATVTIQIDDTSQLSDFLKAIILETLPKPASDPKILLSSREVAKLLNISERTCQIRSYIETDPHWHQRAMECN